MRPFIFLFICCNLLAATARAQFNYAAENIQLVSSQLGFRPNSPKTLTFFARNCSRRFPDQIPFYIQSEGGRKSRVNPFLDVRRQKVWKEHPYRYPIGIAAGPYKNEEMEGAVYKGMLKRVESRWGTFWQADFSDFNKEGVFQIECEYAFTTPFKIEPRIYDKLTLSYLGFLNGQRSGIDIPGVRSKMHQDDGRLDSGLAYWPAAGGWYDAGDWRKWTSLTQGNVDALSLIAAAGPAGLREKALDELRWGIAFFQKMISDEGRVFEDVAGGNLRLGYSYENGWWVENHPGCIANGGINVTDGIPETGDERLIRTHYNPLCQYLFVKTQCQAYHLLPDIEKGSCLYLAEKAWRYGQAHNGDRRTLFVAEELWAATELYLAGSKAVSEKRLSALATELLSRQEPGTKGLRDYFMEQQKSDGYRSVAFSSEPALALLHFSQSNVPALAGIRIHAGQAVKNYIEHYLLADAASNPFAYTPYGVYVKPPYPDLQTFRPAGREDRFVRSFIHLFSESQMPHGDCGVLMSQAYLLAKTGHDLKIPAYQQAAERLIAWVTGHNTEGLCLATGIGYRHPVTANFVEIKIPNALPIGFLGTPADEPYMETSNAVEWSTQEQWDVPFYYLADAIAYLD